MLTKKDLEQIKEIVRKELIANEKTVKAKEIIKAILRT